MLGMISSFLGAGLNTGLQFLQNDINQKHDLKMQNNNYNFQKEFAQNGIQWRANDARSAGIHPLAAMGANVSQGPSMAVGNANSAPVFKPDFLQIQNQKLQNDLLKAQIANLNGQTLRNTTEVAAPRMASLTDMPGQSSSLTQANRAALQNGTISGYDKEPINLYSFGKDSEGNIFRSPSRDLPDAYTEGPLSLGLAAEMFRQFSDKELGRIADRLIKNGEFNPETHDLVTGISPLGRFVKIQPKNEPTYLENFKSGLKNIKSKLKNIWQRR